METTGHRSLFHLAFLLLIVRGATRTFSLTACPDRWTAYKGSCYLAGHSSVHFTEAEQFCRQHGSHLVHLDNEDENNFVKGFLDDLPAKSWWLGLTDETIENYWMWFDTDTVANFTDFHPTEPNHDGDCALFYSPYRYDWVDVSCNGLFYPFCEISRYSTQVIVG